MDKFGVREDMLDEEMIKKFHNLRLDIKGTRNSGVKKRR